MNAYSSNQFVYILFCFFPQQFVTTMIPPQEESLVYDVRLSSVGPGQLSGSDQFHNPSGLDLAMKLHYLRVVYFFESEAAKDLTVMKIKESMFYWLIPHFIPCGRFRKTESGRPFIKCNDCGARFIEAKCSKTLDEWLEMKDWPSYKLLVSQQVIGPELSFSPLVLLQVTFFKCGGISMGLSWAHVLGDPLSASEFMKTWGQFISGLRPNIPSNIPRSAPLTQEPQNHPEPEKDPVSEKRVNPVGDHWIPANNCKMDTFSFHLTSSQLIYLQAQIWGPNIEEISHFESLCAVIWRCIAKIPEGSEPNRVTICRKDPYNNRGHDIIGNKQLISKVEPNFSIANADLRKLASMLADEGVDERKEIEKAVENDQGVTDFFVYGANLTFLDLEEADLYGLELKGLKPKFVYCTLQGVGDEGAIVVLPCPKGSIKNSNEGRFVTIILPEDQLGKLKTMLKDNGLLLNGDLE